MEIEINSTGPRFSLQKFLHSDVLLLFHLCSDEEINRLSLSLPPLLIG